MNIGINCPPVFEKFPRLLYVPTEHETDCCKFPPTDAKGSVSLEDSRGLVLCLPLKVD